MTLEGTSAARSYISRIRSSRCLQGRGQRGPRWSILGSQAQHGSGHSTLLRVTHGSSWFDRRTLWGPRSQPTVAKGLAVRSRSCLACSGWFNTFLSAPVMAAARQPGGVGDQPRSGRGVGARSPGSSWGNGQVVRRHRKQGVLEAIPRKTGRWCERRRRLPRGLRCNRRDVGWWGTSALQEQTAAQEDGAEAGTCL